MIRRPPRSTHCISSAASDVYKRQLYNLPGHTFSRSYGVNSVSYTHLTLPTICSVQISVVAVSLKKKKKKMKMVQPQCLPESDIVMTHKWAQVRRACALHENYDRT
eukprot:TRINITY_DN1382_c0_g1_i2.p4 TRINITY_DN1382_c0_g1~~TRINITY_DN1382_c0_g1_i2.p4  ORF type:complete len:106 (-),score=29.36 TRINITY_DN1382_c0_g1_i2:20-337(-)